MSMHRRWLFSSAGKALVSSALMSFVRSGAEAQPVGPPDLPTQSSGQSKKELIEHFYTGIDVGGVHKWGLNPAGPASNPELDDTRVILPQHLDAFYTDRFKAKFDHPPALHPYTLLREQAAFLGALTRCMWENDDKTAPVSLKHLHWAREALGFALNSKLQGRYCKIVVKDAPAGSIRILGPQLDQPCVLC